MDGGEGMQLSCTPHFKGSKKQTRQFASKLLYFGRQYGAFKNFCPQVGRMPNYISMVQNEFQIIFQEKNKVSTIKIQTEMHFEKHIVQPKQVRLRSETHQLTIIVSASHFALSLNFHLYFEAAGPSCFNVFCKIRPQSKFQLELLLDQQNG